MRGKRPPGRYDQRTPLPISTAPLSRRTDNAFALILPEVSANAMQVYLDKLAETIGPDEHVLLVLDQAAWHEAKTVRIPANTNPRTPAAPLPELNPVERVSLFLKKNSSRTGCSTIMTPSLMPQRLRGTAWQGARTPRFPLLLPFDYELRQFINGTDNTTFRQERWTSRSGKDQPLQFCSLAQNLTRETQSTEQTFGKQDMDKQEFLGASSLAAVFSVRLLGLFMIYPVFAAYAGRLSGSTPFGIGLALGIYGLGQGPVANPFWHSIRLRVGRKVMIILGLMTLRSEAP